MFNLVEEKKAQIVPVRGIQSCCVKMIAGTRVAIAVVRRIHFESHCKVHDFGNLATK